MPTRGWASKISAGFLKGVGKRPNGPRLPIGAGGGQVVLDSQPQNPLGLQGHDVLAIRTACRSLLFSSGLQIVETLVWLIWQLPSPHLHEASP